MVKTLISESTYLLATRGLKKLKNEGTVYKKLQAVKMAYEHGIKASSEFLGIFPVSIRNWAKLINDNKMEELKIGSKHKEGIKIKTIHKVSIREWLLSNPNMTINEIKHKLAGECKLVVSKSTVHRCMKEDNFSYITGRPVHYKQNKTSVEEF